MLVKKINPFSGKITQEEVVMEVFVVMCIVTFDDKRISKIFDSYEKAEAYIKDQGKYYSYEIQREYVR